ncbi:hypothetical protein GCM10010299_15670 [Streptomyces tanashiensis]|nr:hypothetical protein GCM10010299_15670 [Streptomyces tanashiensis]
MSHGEGDAPRAAGLRGGPAPADRGPMTATDGPAEPERPWRVAADAGAVLEGGRLRREPAYVIDRS